MAAYSPHRSVSRGGELAVGALLSDAVRHDHTLICSACARACVCVLASVSIGVQRGSINIYIEYIVHVPHNDRELNNAVRGA